MQRTTVTRLKTLRAEHLDHVKKENETKEAAGAAAMPCFQAEAVVEAEVQRATLKRLGGMRAHDLVAIKNVREIWCTREAELQQANSDPCELLGRPAPAEVHARATD